ncbi:MAG: DUF4250 domain-containing protein [Lachnospiraceae bacterium]|nr:DUF4250 domain-containing protein [Lachnospiraceae bacterium]
MNIPNDPAMLLGFVNLKLRDFYKSLDEMCDDMSLEKKDIEDKLSAIGYEYDESTNSFV